MNKLKLISVKFLIALLVFSFVGLSASDRKDGKLLKPKSTQNNGDSYRLFINKINLPINDKGKIADVNIPPQGPLGRFDDIGVIYSSGFMMSGKTNGVVWSNAVASSSRIEDYIPGSIDPLDSTHTISPGIFVVKATDPAFGESWQEWANAVKGGAYFYDGDGDGIYNPVDKNGNGIWDPDEDMPDLLGDETVWCVYNDGLPASDRRFTDVSPQGIDIRQTVWAFSSAGSLGNIVFVRYSIVNRGTVADEIDSVYFGVWADPDLGDYADDLVGSDSTLNAGYVYNDGPDREFGDNPPTFLIDFFQGPIQYTGNDNDTAYNVRGPLLGADTIKGAINLPLTSFVHYMQSHPTQGDPDNKEQARYYLEGKNQAGEYVDPCDWEFGTVLGMNCADVDGKMMYSGDPVTMYGWINTYAIDQRQMSNTGPFKLIKDKPIDIVAAYVIGRGKTSALESVTTAKKIDKMAQFIYGNNFVFPTPPAVHANVSTEDNVINLSWNTADQVTFKDSTEYYDMFFEGYEVKMFQNGTTNKLNGNMKIIARYDIADSINDIYDQSSNSPSVTKLYSKGIQLDRDTYGNPVTGWLNLRIDKDPFTNGPLIKGKPYFISITSYALNKKALLKYNDDAKDSNYVLSRLYDIKNTGNSDVIIKGPHSIVGIVPGSNSYDPYITNGNTKHIEGASETNITYTVVNKSLTKADEYEIGFYLDSLSTVYSLYYYIKDKTTDTILSDSSKNYDNVEKYTGMVDGFTVDVPWKAPEQPEYNSLDWAIPYKNDTTGAFYIGNDIDTSKVVLLVLSQNNSDAIRANRMRRVELRFGVTSKGYRYIYKRHAYKYAEGLLNSGPGFVDLPFQAWVVDDRFGEQYQLAVGYTEDARQSSVSPPGVYDPSNDIALTKEYIIIFDSPYDPTGSNIVYTGDHNQANYSNGYNLSAAGISDSMKTIANSPFFNTMYLVGLERIDTTGTFNPTGTLVINPEYFLTEKDKYSFVPKLNITDSEAKSMFEKVNVYPNPLYAYNPLGSYEQGSKFRADDPFVTFTNLPNKVTVKIFSLSGTKLRTLEKNDTNPFLNWDLKNEDGLRVASGMYIAIVSNPKYGDKVLKFAIIMPQKQIQRY